MTMFHNSGVAPKIMTLETLKEITNNFSKEQELGSGMFGTVYKGVNDGQEIAVKHLRPQGHGDHEKFKAEFENLWRLRHPNIVQLLGYCYETRHELVQFEGRHVWADNIYRALCFEYMHNGSLENHLFDERSGHDWQTRYKIIKGICDGLKYLHEGLNIPMYHLDLKPDNILLDKNKVPKLADFGLSKFIENDQTQATQSCIGTRGYMPPEYIKHNLVSNKFDIFSLGVVMIRIITGNEGFSKKADMSSQQFINDVYEDWKSRIHATSGCTTPEAKCRQVRACIKIALDCVNTDRKKRPTIGDIVRRLNELEPRISAAPARPQQISVAEGPKDSDTDVNKGLTKLQKATTKALGNTRFQMPSPGFGKQLDQPALGLRFPLELNKGIQCHGILTDRCEEVNKINGVSQISIDKEQVDVMVSGLMDSDNIVKKPNNKDANSQQKKLHPTRGANGQPKDAGANEQNSGVCSKDAKTVLPQPTVQQPQQTQIKELKEPQQPKLISPRGPFAVAVPVKVDSGEEDSIFDGFFENFDGLMLLDTNRCEEVNKVEGTSKISIDKEQGDVMVSGLIDSNTIVKKPNNKDANSQLKKLHPPRGAKGQPEDAGANDQKNGVCSKDAKTVLPQPMVQQPQQTQIKEMKEPQQPKLISPKVPFVVAVPVKEDSGEEHSIFDENFDGLTLLDTNRCEEVNKINGVSQISIDKGQGNVMVSGLMDSDSIVKKPNNKDANSQLKKQHLTRGAKSQPKDTGANDQKNGVCSKDAKMVLPQPTVQPPQQKQIKELKVPQQPKLISPKVPFAVAVPVKKGPKSVQFKAPDVDTEDDSMSEDYGEEHSIFDGFSENFDGFTLLDTNNAEEGFKINGFSEPKTITKPLAMPLDANGGDNNGANGGSEIQAQIKGNNNAIKMVSSAKQNQGSCHGSSGGGRHMQKVNDVALGVMMGLAGLPGMCQQTGGGSVDSPDTGSMQHGSGGVVSAAMGMLVRGMPALPEFYQQGVAAASTTMPTGQAMLQDDAVAARNTMAARQQHMAPAEQQQQQPKVSRSKKMQ